jgi:hypothetical protein
MKVKVENDQGSTWFQITGWTVRKENIPGSVVPGDQFGLTMTGVCMVTLPYFLLPSAHYVSQLLWV